MGYHSNEFSTVNVYESVLSLCIHVPLHDKRTSEQLFQLQADQFVYILNILLCDV